MSTETADRKRSPRPKQAKLPGEVGTDPKSIPAIEEAAENLDEVRTDRIKLTEQESDLQELLIKLMGEHKLTMYKYDGKTVTIDTKAKARIKHAKDADNEAQS